MSFNREQYFSDVERELGQKLSLPERKMLDDFVSETGGTVNDSVQLVRHHRKVGGWKEWLPLVYIGIAITLAPRAYDFYQDNYSYAAQTLHAAQQVSDPMNAHAIIEKERTKCVGESMLWPDKCYPERLSKADEMYLVKAVTAGNAGAIRELYDSKSWGNTAIRTTFRAQVLKVAEASKNPDILASAAAIYRDDEINIVNTEKEKEYLYSAWRMGDRVSASRLAQIYRDQKETDKAYLWSLRCIQECKRSTDIDLSKLSEKLPPEAVTKIQEKAQEAE